MGEVSRIYVIADHGFNYTTTLLSSQPISNDTRSETLDSVLVLSFYHHVNFKWHVQVILII